MKQPNFTGEELLYIEKLMDANSAMSSNPMQRIAETGILLKSAGENKVAELLFRQFFELGEGYLITKSIRDKIEKWRKQKFINTQS